MTDKTHYFHFTLGPVQGFVSQARRTRDFWAGSFILSWLAAVAIKAVQHQKGNIQFPHADENYMLWLEGKGKQNPPLQGSIPNRFKSLVAAVNPDTFKPEQVVEAVQEAWKALADKVWEEDLGHISPSHEASIIWDRQIQQFWEMSWVITADKSDSSALDKRKNWRTYVAPKEPGVKCAMMDGWQELSGEERPDRKKMEVFWKTLRENGRHGMKSDLRENEALCAMAFVKRRFSRHFAKLNHTMVQQGWQLKGWKVPSTIPSVTYMAAVHWLEQALKKAKPEVLQHFQQVAADLTDDEYGEWDTNIRCLEPFAKEYKHLKSLDGNVFFETSLENTNIFPAKLEKKVDAVKKALQAIKNNAGLSDPTPFYAILLMDGDSLGSHMSNTDLHYSITQGLADFTNGVPAIVKDKNGFLIYAGGDDVLAILPLEDAITCAAALRAHYLKCFKAQPNSDPEKDRQYIPTTLSGAIEFVHINTPLTSVLKDAHKLLDDVAKDGSGRDALAIRVWKRGGLQLEWSQPWKVILRKTEDKDRKEIKVPIILELVEKFQKNQDIDKDFSNKFFYKIRERFDLLNPPLNKNKKYEDFSIFSKEDQAIKLMTMEYLNSWGSKNQKDTEEAVKIVTNLLDQCRPLKRKLNKSCDEWLQVNINDLSDDCIKKYKLFPNAKSDTDEDKYNITQLKNFKIWKADGALLVRFLAQKGVE